MDKSHPFSRRKLLGLGAAAGAGLALGLPANPAAAHGTSPYATIWNQPTYYENLATGQAYQNTFHYEPTFHSQCDAWLMDWYGFTPTNWVTPVQIWSNGVHNDDPNKPNSLHTYGRALDLSRMLVRISGTQNYVRAFYSRYDIWRNWSGTDLTTVAKYYWGTVASLNKHFGVVLHHHYNTEHHNHVHVDNAEANTFRLSRAQVQMVQAVCNVVWGVYPLLAVDGAWGPRTDTNSRFVLQRYGRSGGLTTSTANWHSFCMTSLGQATGRFNY